MYIKVYKNNTFYKPNRRNFVLQSKVLKSIKIRTQLVVLLFSMITDILLKADQRLNVVSKYIKKVTVTEDSAHF